MQKEETIKKIAARIVAYYQQVISIKKAQGVKTFVIDAVEKAGHGRTLSLVGLIDKYDGRSLWRSDGLGITDNDDWHTLPGSFREAFGTSNNDFYIDGGQLFQKISVVLSKEGIANYFDDNSEGLQSNYFSHKYEKLLWVVL